MVLNLHEGEIVIACSIAHHSSNSLELVRSSIAGSVNVPKSRQLHLAPARGATTLWAVPRMQCSDPPCGGQDNSQALSSLVMHRKVTYQGCFDQSGIIASWSDIARLSCSRVTMAPLRLAPPRSAPLRSAPPKSASLRSAPPRSASLRLAPLRIAPLRLALLRLALLRSPSLRSALFRWVSLRLALPRLALRRLAPPRSAPPSLAQLRWASLRSAPLRSALYRLATLRWALLRSAPSRSIILLPISIRPDACRNWSTLFLRSLSKRGRTVSVRTRPILRTSSSGFDSRNFSCSKSSDSLSI